MWNGLQEQYHPENKKMCLPQFTENRNTHQIILLMAFTVNQPFAQCFKI